MILRVELMWVFRVRAEYPDKFDDINVIYSKVLNIVGYVTYIFCVRTNTDFTKICIFFVKIGFMKITLLNVFC